MGVIEDGQTVRAGGDNSVERAGKAVDRLQGKTVNEIDIDRLEAVAPGRVHDGKRLFFRLNAVDGFLHIGIEILHAETRAVEAKLTQQHDCPLINRAWVDLDRVFAAIAV